MPTNLSKNELATILSALDGQPRSPANRDKALAALERKAAALGLTTDEILAAAPGLLDGRLSPADWLAEITDSEAAEPATDEEVETPTEEPTKLETQVEDQDAAEAPTLPKLNLGERQLLANIARNLMIPVNGAEPKALDDAGSVWRDCLDQGPETIMAKSMPGLVASLTKKGLASADGESVGLTPLGFAAYQSVAPRPQTARTRHPRRRPSRSLAKAPSRRP